MYWEPLLGEALGRRYRIQSPRMPRPKHGERLRGLSPLYLYHSRDDAESPFEHLERYRSVLPQATVRVLDGRGHEFNQAQFPELVADIRGLATRRAI